VRIGGLAVLNNLACRAKRFPDAWLLSRERAAKRAQSRRFRRVTPV
jgi:hypothetical protein